jgi:hypothetical protein
VSSNLTVAGAAQARQTLRSAFCFPFNRGNRTVATSTNGAHSKAAQTESHQSPAWYGRDARGRARRYDDLPRELHGNVNTEPPFAPLPGNRARLDAAEIADLLAFLETLSDGYAQAADPAAR